jgi:hypothetical protein
MNQNEVSQKDMIGTSKGHIDTSLSDINTTLVQNTLKNTGEFFYSHKDNQTFFAFGKKAEKIITAIYMVTDFFEDNEPLKTRIRGLGVSLVSDLFSCMALSHHDRVRMLAQSITHSETLISLVTMMESLRFISAMNAHILIEEITKLQGTLETELQNLHAVSGGTSNHAHGRHTSVHNDAVQLSTQLFDMPLFDTLRTTQQQDISIGHDKGHAYTMSDKVGNSVRYESLKSDIASSVKDTQSESKIPTESEAIENKDVKQKQKDFTQIQKDNQNIRIRQVLAIFDKGHEYSIKDITDRFPHVSVKTIQRDLLSLVADGKITRSGEKRWVKYKLVTSD